MARLVVVTAPEQSAGFRLAGAAMEEASGPEDAARIINDLVRRGEGGIVAVHEPLLAGMDPDHRRRLEELANPVVVALPVGTAEGGEGARRGRLADLLRRSIGYWFAFPGEER
jgi:vacuolar-type H+-ATPase subunit F/Vma7